VGAFVLASTSPRRRALLEAAGCDFKAVSPGLDDAHLQPGSGTPSGWVAALAYLKATAAARRLRNDLPEPPPPVVGSDTTCVLGDRVIGTPTTEEEAREMINAFVGHSHEVLTGVAIVCPKTGHRELFTERAVVTLGDLPAERIEEYIATDGWHGKAGGYNYTERKADGWPLHCEGDENTVVGLPVRALLERLRSWRASRA